MKALSGYPQWFWLMAKGWKDVENRTWPLPKNMVLPVRIYLHGSRTLEDWDCKYVIKSLIDPWQFTQFECVNWKQYQGTIMGEIDIVSFSYRMPENNDNLYSPWHIPGQYGFKTANPVLYDKPIPYKGQLGFFSVELPIGTNR